MVHLAHFRIAQGSTIVKLEHQTSYLVESIFERLLVYEREANEEDISESVTESSQSFVIVLASSIPERI